MKRRFMKIGFAAMGLAISITCMPAAEKWKTPIANVVQAAEADALQNDSIVLADFEAETIGTAGGFQHENGWLYNKKVAPKVAEINGSKALELDLDYTGCEEYTWSEAKVKKIYYEGLNVSEYNMLTYDLIYPKALEGQLKAKIFAKDAAKGTVIINKEGVLKTQDLGDGNMLAKVTVKFSPSTAKITDLTIGTVGVKTDFVGKVYLDNLTLVKYNPENDFVDITAKVGDAAAVDVSEIADKTVSLADSNASDTTRALYAYLKHLDAKDQVLFGHQNDTHKHVTNREDVFSDTKDITGSISGVVGIDSLALTGIELGIKDADIAVSESVKIGTKAAQEGAILTLSAHMPNMGNKKIKKNEDGTYDFSACDFEESKDLSNNCAEESLPGGKYNDRFNAYLDIIAEYAKGLGDIPVLFRPFHECNGGWFWWGAASTDADTYKALYQYTVDYLTEQGVHNFIYVYSPGGPVKENSYMKRYPGKNYVDILGFDYYDDYSTYDAKYSDSFMKNLKASCETLKTIADQEGKLAAISETGVRVMKEDGSDSEGLLVKDNPITGQNWYGQVNDIAKETGMSYFLLWANFGDTNFYVPYKYNDTKGQELINEFIDFYNEDSSIFANGTNFYDKADKIETTTGDVKKEASGYFENVFSKMTISEEKTLNAVVKNLPEDSNVEIVLENTENGEKISLKVKDKGANQYEATLTKADMEKIGATDAAKLTLFAGDQELAVRKYITIGKQRATLAKNVIENFELYYDDDDYIDSIYSVNSAAGCDSDITLEKTDKSGGNYAGAFHYILKTDRNEVWTGRKKSIAIADYSNYNALSLWIKPDGLGQKLVIQLVSNGEDFEAFLTDFTATTKAQYVTIPFDKLKGKNGGKFDPKNVTNFAVWCNSIPGNKTDIESRILLDDVQFVYVEETSLALQGQETYKLSDTLIGNREGKPSSSENNDDKKPVSKEPVSEKTVSKEPEASVTTKEAPKEAATESAKVKAPAKVTISSLKKSGKKATLKWKKVSGASGYQIYMKTGSGKYKLVKTIKKGTTVKYTKTKLKKGSKYTFKVRAYKTVNGKKVYGAYSKTKSVRIK